MWAFRGGAGWPCLCFWCGRGVLTVNRKGDPGLELGSPFFVYVLFLHPATVYFGKFSFEFVAPESAVFGHVDAVDSVEVFASVFAECYVVLNVL